MFFALCLVLLALLGHLLWKRYKMFQILKDAGHIGPPTNYLYGQYFELNREGHYKVLDRWFKEYNSDVVGFYYGSQPFVAIRDVDIAKQVLVKDFQKFRNRTQTLRMEAIHPFLGSHVLFLSDKRWKYIRNFMTPSFSTVNLREMYARLSCCVDTFMSTLASMEGNSFNTHPVVRRLTLDNISRSAFSVVSGVQKDPLGARPAYQEAVEDSIDKLGEHWLGVLTQCFQPAGEFLFRWLHPLGLLTHCNDPMANFIKLFVKMRETEKKDDDWVDFMQNIINGGKGEGMEKRKFHKELEFKMTNNEVVGNCLLFIQAAFETSSGSLSFLFFELASHPEVQTKLRNELRKGLSETDDKTLTYDFIMNHTYLDMVVNEGQRMYPVAYGFVGREANDDFEYKGVKIPKGVDVIFPLYSIQRDPRYFEDPNTFNPERFSPEKKGLIPFAAFMPFGEGQRSCIGNRFALMQLKHVVARVILQYELCLDPDHHVKGEPVALVDRAGVNLEPKAVHITLKSA